MKRTILEELKPQLDQGKGCILFDFGVYFPYHLRDDERLIFEIRLGEEKMPEYKLNHRYNNKAYYTISRKKEKGLYHSGYPYFFDLNGEDPFTAILCIRTGIFQKNEEKTVDILFPLIFQPTKERPAAALSLRYIFDDGILNFTSYTKDETQTGWNVHYWSNRKKSVKCDDNYTYLEVAEANKEEMYCVYAPFIELIPQRVEDLVVL